MFPTGRCHTMLSPMKNLPPSCDVAFHQISATICSHICAIGWLTQNSAGKQLDIGVDQYFTSQTDVLLITLILMKSFTHGGCDCVSVAALSAAALINYTTFGRHSVFTAVSVCLSVCLCVRRLYLSVCLLIYVCSNDLTVPDFVESTNAHHQKMHRLLITSAAEGETSSVIPWPQGTR